MVRMVVDGRIKVKYFIYSVPGIFSTACVKSRD
jgi:hypothetical protein